MPDKLQRYAALLTLWSLLATGGSACLAQTSEIPWRFPAAERVVAFGDVHGAYRELTRTLIAAGILDEALNWAGGTTQLVSVGDLLDRGADSRAVMDLLMRLESEAAEAGGQVHVVMGNHELMNLAGDLRYVASGEYAAFAGDEPADLRRREREQFAAGQGDPSVSADFDARFPAGFFAHRSAFAPDGKYGRWLLDKPVLLVIGDTAFTHGGLTPLVAELGGAALNRRLRAELLEFLSLWRALAETGQLSLYSDPHNRVSAIEDRLALADGVSGELNPIEPERAQQLRRFVALSKSDIFDEDGPLWYRGTASCHELLESDVTAAALAALNVRRVVVGHTPTESRRVEARMDDTALVIDTGMLTEYYHGRPAALILAGDGPRVIYPPSPEAVEPDRPDRGLWWSRLEEATALRVLDGGKIIDRQALPDGSGVRVTLEAADGPVTAMFRTAGDYRDQVAAYRMDRMLGLNLVPPAVVRRIDRENGALLLWPDDPVDEPRRQLERRARQNRCARGIDYDLMYAFDALIHNESRTADSIYYLGSDMRLFLAGHRHAFGSDSGFPQHLEDRRFVLSPRMRERLASLDARVIRDALKGLISKREIKALLKRRDQILRNPPSPETG